MNRKEKIENLKNEIAQKQQTLNELITAENRKEPDEDLSAEDLNAVKEFINDIL